jgi:hypothetical protein
MKRQGTIMGQIWRKKTFTRVAGNSATIRTEYTPDTSHSVTSSSSRAMPWLKRLVAGFPPQRPGCEPGSGQVGFVVDKVALGQVFPEYFGFPCQSSFHQILYHHNHPGQVQYAIQWPMCQVDTTWTQPPPPPHYANSKKKIPLQELLDEKCWRIRRVIAKVSYVLRLI